MKNMLFNPGPTNVCENVRNALLTEDMSHREPHFTETLARVNQSLIELLDGEGTHSSVMFVASGTGANDAMINCIHGKILAINHGRYSERLCKIADRYKIPLCEYKIPELNLLDLNVLESFLKKDKKITHIMLVHHETTTGMLEPLREIGVLASQYNKLLIIDGVSSVGAHAFSLKKDNIALCGINANKCLESLPGISFVLGKTDEIMKLNGKSRSFYFDLFTQWDRQSKGEVPYTAAIQLVFAMDAALKILKTEGYENRISRYKALAEQMRRGLIKLGFTTINFPEGFQSNVLTLLELPEKLDFKKMHDLLYSKGITIYTDSASLKEGRFFVATMGSITSRDVEYFLTNLEDVLKKMDTQIEFF